MAHRRTIPAIRVTVVVAGLLLSLAPVGTASAAGGAASPFRVSEYRYQSEAGDYIGQGSRAVVSNPDRISVTGDAAFVRANVAGDGGWAIWLRAPEGGVLSPGVFAHAERASFATGGSPGLDVFGNGRGCNEVFGRFVVNQLRTDASGNVTALDVRFVQRCESADAPALRGWLRYRVAPLSYAFTSDAGDYIGSGLRRRYEGATATFSPWDQYGGGVRVSIVNTNGNEDWTIVLMPPEGTALTKGIYADAQRAPFADHGHPGLAVYGNGRGCNTLTGSFEVLAVRFAEPGLVSRLHATFEQHCEGVTQALRGEIRFHA